MEIAAAAAPRPQLLVAATGDWTRTTREIEGPAIADIYRLFGPGGQFRYEVLDFPHNYNQTTREAAYAFMAEQLLGRSRADRFPEQPYEVDPQANLRIWSNHHVPQGAKSREQYQAYLIEQCRTNLAAKWPENRAGLNSFKLEMNPIYRAVFQLAPDPQELEIKVGSTARLANGARLASFEITGHNASQKIPVRVVTPRRNRTATAVVLANPVGMSTSFDTAGEPIGFASELLAAGHTIVAFDGFLTGSQADNAELEQRDHHREFFSTYNRTDLQERVGDLVNVGAFVQSHLPDHKVVLHGKDQAGLWVLLAAPAADAVVADAAEFDANDDRLWLQQDWFTPSIRRIGTFDGPALLAAPNPVLIHNAGLVFPTQTISGTYQRLGAATSARVHRERLRDAALLNWIGEL
jgi:hypothetical protein